MSHHPPLHPDESEPIALNPLLRGVDLAVDRLIRRDCFTGRTLDILDELREELLAVSDTYSDNKDIPLPTESVNSLNIDLEGDPQMTLDDLRKIAEAANVRGWINPDCGSLLRSGNYHLSENALRFIATFNPAKVLELIDQLATVKRVNETNRGAVEILEARLAEHEQAVENMSTKTDDLLSKLAAVEKLHRPTDGHNPECHCGVPPNDGRDCRVCQADAWPCETIKAARGE